MLPEAVSSHGHNVGVGRRSSSAREPYPAHVVYDYTNYGFPPTLTCLPAHHFHPLLPPVYWRQIASGPRLQPVLSLLLMRAWSPAGKRRAAASIFYPKTKHTLKAGARTTQLRAGRPWVLLTGVGSAFFINPGVAVVFDITSGRRQPFTACCLNHPRFRTSTFIRLIFS